MAAHRPIRGGYSATLALTLVLGVFAPSIFSPGSTPLVAQSPPPVPDPAHAPPGSPWPTIRVLYNDRPPLYIVRDKGGFLTTITILVLTQAGLNWHLEDMPSNRITDTIREGKSPAMGIGWFRNPEREAWALFSDPLYTDQPQVVLVNKALGSRLPARPTILDCLRSPLVLGRKSGYSFGTLIDSAIEASRPEVYSTTVEVPNLIRMVDAGRVGYTFLGPEEATWHLANATLRNVELRPLADAPPGNARHLMLSKSLGPEVLARINAAIAVVKASPDYQRLTTF